MAASQRMGVPCCACWQEVSHRLAARLVRHVLERAWVPTVQDLLWTWRRPAGRPRPWHLGWAALGNLGASRTQNFCDIVPISCVSYLPHPIPPSSSPPHCHFSLASPPWAASTCAACPPRDSPTCTCCPPTTFPPSMRTRRRGGMWVSRDPRVMLECCGRWRTPAVVFHLVLRFLIVQRAMLAVSRETSHCPPPSIVLRVSVYLPLHLSDESVLRSFPPDSDLQQAAVVAVQNEDAFNWG